MSKQRGTFFGLITVAILSQVMRMKSWVDRTNQDINAELRRGSPIFTPKRKKLKGYQKTTGRKKNFHKFKQH